jgi:hypothetical protein
MSWFTIATCFIAGGIGVYLFVEISWYCFCIAFRIIDNYLNG